MSTSVKPTIFCQLTDKTAILILSFIGGYVDAFGYMNLEEIFTASITGNIVVASLSIVKDQHGMLARILTTALFFLGGLFITLILFQLRRCHQLKKHSLVIVAFCFEILCLLLALIIGVMINYYGYNFNSIDSMQVIVMSSLLGFTMGIHNGATIEAIKDPPSTTVLTMTLVKLSISVANILEHYTAKNSYKLKLNQSHSNSDTLLACIIIDDTHLTQINQNYDLAIEKTLTSIQPVVAFVIGAIVASGVNLKLTFPNLIIPIGLLILLIIDIYRSKGNQSTDDNGDSTEPARTATASELAVLAGCQTNTTQFETQATYEAAAIVDMDSQGNDSIV